jgi:integrase
MSRRDPGIQVYETPSGEKRYRVRWREGGRHRSRSFSRLEGEHGARAFHRKVREARESRTRLVPADREELTLAVFVADVWAPRARRRLAAKTWERDTAVYNRHILHQLGDRPLATLDAEDLVEWQDRLERDGVGAPTIVKAMSILSSVFREAARRSRSTGVTANPVALLDKPSAKRRRRPLVWGPVVVERARYQLLVNSRRAGAAAELMAMRDALLVSFMEMTGCRPGEALALRWCDLGERVEITRGLSGSRVLERTKTGRDRVAPIYRPLQADLDALRRHSADGPEDFVIQKPAGGHWLETDWRNFRSRHFVPALERLEEEWASWREGLEDPGCVRETVAGLSRTRPYDLGRHTHSALMLASGMSLQRLARIQGHSIRVLDETYSEELAEFSERGQRIDPVREIEAARALVWGPRDPSTGEVP